MKNRLEIIILSSLIAILALYIVFRDNKNINYEIPKLEKIAKEDITKLSYNDFEITKKEVWYLPSGFEIDSSKIDRLLSDASSVKLIDMISDNKDYTRFGLDDPDTLKFFKNDQLLLELALGNKSSTGNYTYVKLTNRDEVYSVRGDLKSIFNKTEGDLRNRRVLTLDQDSVSEIILTKSGETETKTGDDAKSYSGNILELNCDTFSDLDRSEELIKIEVKQDSITKTLTIFNMVDDKYPALSSDVDFPFTLPTWVVDKLLETE